MPGGTKKIAKNIQCSKLEFDSLSEGWPVVWIVRPRLDDPAQKGRGTAVLYEVEVWATGVEGIFPEPFLFLFGSSHQPPGPRRTGRDRLGQVEVGVQYDSAKWEPGKWEPS